MGLRGYCSMYTDVDIFYILNSRLEDIFIYTSSYLLVVYPSSLIAIANHNATYLTVIYVILNPVWIAAHNAVINLNIMTVKLIVYFQINLKGFKTEVARDRLVNLAQGEMIFDDLEGELCDPKVYSIQASVDHHLRFYLILDFFIAYVEVE